MLLGRHIVDGWAGPHLVGASAANACRKWTRGRVSATEPWLRYITTQLGVIRLKWVLIVRHYFCAHLKKTLTTNISWLGERTHMLCCFPMRFAFLRKHNRVYSNGRGLPRPRYSHFPKLYPKYSPTKTCVTESRSNANWSVL